MSGGAIVGLIAVVGFGLLIAAAFFWAMPREENPGPLQTIWWGVRGTPEVEVGRRLRRMQEAASRDGGQGAEGSEGAESFAEEERLRRLVEGGGESPSGR